MSENGINLRQTISQILLQHALDYLNRAQDAANENQPLDEISACIGAQLMIAVVIEGVANEISAVKFNGTLLDQFERTDTLMKWYILSGIEGREPFNFGREPLQTVQTLMTTRNKIVHPRVEKFGTEIMIRKPSGELLRNVSPDRLVEPDDHIIYGADEHLKRFNYVDTAIRVQNGVRAIDQLCQHLSITDMRWTKEVLAELS